MHYWTDLYLTHDVANAVIAAAVAGEFGVSVSQIAVTPRGTQQSLDAWDRPNLFALVQRENVAADDPAYPFPWEVSIAFREDRPEIDDLNALQNLGRKLDAPFIASADVDSQDTMRLFWPDGTSQLVSLDDDDNVILSEADRERLRRTSHHAAAA